ncbi:MAG: family 20 glycosylhydrolase [Acidobacteriota bacterium]
MDHTPESLLVPRPRRLERRVGVWCLPGRLEVEWPGDAEGMAPVAATWLREALPAGGRGVGAVVLRQVPSVDGSAARGYVLDVSAKGAAIEAATPRALLHGVATLAQWLRVASHRGEGGDEEGDGEPVVPAVRVVDAPDLARRGVLLDISRNRIPRLDELEATIDRLARLKIDMVQLYMEHTFAYAGHDAVWRDWDPLTPAHVRRLDAFCRARGVELVPNQNSFGHMHRWLVHSRYRPLAECPDGIEHPFSLEPEPFSLCPLDPRALELLDDLYGQLLPCFSCLQFNVGLDETFELGRCRSRDACAAQGRGRVYLDFLRAVDALARRHGRRSMVWGDIVLEHPELVAELPPEVTVMAWGYEPDHPFANDAPRFAEAGRPFYLCPGTASWSGFAPRIDDALANLASAAHAAREHGAEGLLICDWGDHGHLQPPPTAWPGLLAGAALAWRVDDASRLTDDPDLLARWLDRHVVAGGAGAALVGLGQAHRAVGVRVRNGSPLFHGLLFAHADAAQRRVVGVDRATGLERRVTLDDLDAAEDAIAAALTRLGPPPAGENDLLGDELRWVAEALRTTSAFERARLVAASGATSDPPLKALPSPVRRRLAARLDALAHTLRPLWLARCRPGGLEASIARLLHCRRLLVE